MATTADPVLPQPLSAPLQRRGLRKPYWRQPFFVRSNFQLSAPDSPGSIPAWSTPTSVSPSAADTHPQTQSPLFSVLPPELRNAIFALALAQHEDVSRPYPAAHRAARPEYTSPRRVCLALLRTCRRAYHEARHIPLEGDYELTLWCGYDEAAPPETTRIAGATPARCTLPKTQGPWCGGDCRGGQTLEQRYDPRLQQQQQRPQPGRVHVFAQMWWLEQHRLTSLCKAWDLTTPAVTLTIRHTDWRGWAGDDDDGGPQPDDEGGDGAARDHPLVLDRFWLDRWKLPPSVRAFDLELETCERRKAELDAVAAEARQWPLTRRDGVVLSAAGEDGDGALREFRWRGRRKSGGAVCSDGAKGGESMGYYVVTVCWRVVDEGA